MIRVAPVAFLNWQRLDKFGFQGHVQRALQQVFPGEVPGTAARRRERCRLH
jgi:hypothetical protein